MSRALDVDALLRALYEHEVDFVVIGGLAVAAHGYVRATKDLDMRLDLIQRTGDGCLRL